jgi:hypothetical protein
VQHQYLFQDSNIPKSYLTQIRGFSWHKNDIKRIRSGYYSSNNFKDSNKRKRTESKTMGYLPRVLFFNAFELGAESANQVFSVGIWLWAISPWSNTNFEILLAHSYLAGDGTKV